MQTTSVLVSHYKTQFRPTARLRPAARLRVGHAGCAAGAQGIVDGAAHSDDRLLQAHAARLDDAVSGVLRSTTQQVLFHPTLAMLADAFNAADIVLAACHSVRRRVLRTGDAASQAKIQVLLVGVRSALSELEAGLEGIELLPASAPDYMEAKEGSAEITGMGFA